MTVDFERSGIFDKEVDGKVDYRLLSNVTHDVLFEQTIESKATTKSRLEENAGPVVALLFTNRQDNDAAWRATYVRSAHDNLDRFFDALSKWTPLAKADAQ